MLIIGHRGAAGLAPENTVKALEAGLAAGADMLEFDVRLTRDGVPVLSHDFHTLRTHHRASSISRLTLHELETRFADQPITTLNEVLERFFGKTILNIEIKGRSTGKAVVELINSRFIVSPKDWDTILLSSFRLSELSAIRKISQKANLALLHTVNPFLFTTHHRKLRLAAVGFHRFYINNLAIELAKRAEIFTYVYTVDRPATALRFLRKGINGIATNRPDLIIRELDRATERPSRTSRRASDHQDTHESRAQQ